MRTSTASPQLLIQADKKCVFVVNFQHVSDSANVVQRDIKVVSARSDADGTDIWNNSSQQLIRCSQNSRISPASLVLRRVVQLLGWLSSPTRQRSIVTSPTAMPMSRARQKRSQPGDGPSVLESTRTGTHSRGHAGRRQGHRHPCRGAEADPNGANDAEDHDKVADILVERSSGGTQIVCLPGSRCLFWCCCRRATSCVWCRWRRRPLFLACSLRFSCSFDSSCLFFFFGSVFCRMWSESVAAWGLTCTFTLTFVIIVIYKYIYTVGTVHESSTAHEDSSSPVFSVRTSTWLCNGLEVRRRKQ